ncbi:hypothetical protein FVEG_11010 [Fusarium verticillioides 7600]|uniref:Uncharacterized protein n=1 Tax=Gibberella moniliformis (strain M3125 / FGSC 7600) TaxID=334819 RepID=W7MMA1_GIBM7|nr:hypothetical protein FVEG_11010 [Fusarium verticillioides 7600]EWG52216.1 hypothetical protein FVEG_11010 [Fusarium verticillioides 7600]
MATFWASEKRKGTLILCGEVRTAVGVKEGPGSLRLQNTATATSGEPASIELTPDMSSRPRRLSSISSEIIYSAQKVEYQLAAKEPEPAVLDHLELRIYFEAAPSNGIQDVSGRSKDRAVIQHYRYVYYYAILLHFHRVLRHKAPSKIQDLAEKGLHHLEAAEDYPGDGNGSIILWPCLVITSECEREDLQQQALRWLRRRTKHAFGSVNASEKICQECWSWRARDPVESPGTPWLEFIAGTDLDIVPV